MSQLFGKRLFKKKLFEEKLFSNKLFGSDTDDNNSDTTAPVITILAGSDTLDEGVAWVDAGATALDDVDGDITANIITTGTVDNTTPGTYEITYTVSDAAGNEASEIRTVTINSLEYAVDPSFDTTWGLLGESTSTGDGTIHLYSSTGATPTKIQKIGNNLEVGVEYTFYSNVGAAYNGELFRITCENNIGFIDVEVINGIATVDFVCASTSRFNFHNRVFPSGTPVDIIFTEYSLKKKVVSTGLIDSQSNTLIDSVGNNLIYGT